METAECAADAIHDALAAGDLRRLERYGERLREQLRPKYRGYELAGRWLSSPVVIDFVARRARREESLRAALAGVIAETVDPRRVFSPTGLVRAWWG